MLRFRTFVSSEPERSSSLLQFSISYPESKKCDKLLPTKYFYCTYIENYSVNLSPDQPAWVENFTLPQILAVSFETLAVVILPLNTNANHWVGEIISDDYSFCNEGIKKELTQSERAFEQNFWKCGTSGPSASKPFKALVDLSIPVRSWKIISEWTVAKKKKININVAHLWVTGWSSGQWCLKNSAWPNGPLMSNCAMHFTCWPSTRKALLGRGTYALVASTQNL